MRWLRYAMAGVFVVLLGTSPFRGTDISALVPVEVVWIGLEESMVHLETDTGPFGEGRDVSAAIENLKSKAPGKVFLDTADYLIVEKGREELLEQLYTILRPSCMVCCADAVSDLEASVEFLKAHEPKMTLRQWKVENEALPILAETERGFAWHEK